MAALATSLAQSLDELRETIGLSKAESAAAPEAIHKLRRQLTCVDGAFRFCGAHSMQAYCALLRELADGITEPALSPAQSRVLDSACAALMLSLPALRRGHIVPPGSLFASWREVAALLPGPAPTPAAMICLEPASLSASVTAAQRVLLNLAPTSDAGAYPTQALDKMLLDMLRAEAGSDTLHASLCLIAKAVAHFQQAIGERQQQLRWAVIRAYCELLADESLSDLSLARKILSPVVRTMRQAALIAHPSGIELPESCVREALVQIGLFAPVTSLSQAVREGFCLDWQLAPGDDGRQDMEASADMRRLRASLDEVEASWTSTDSAGRHRHLDAVLASLGESRVMSSLESALAFLLECIKNDDELSLAAGLLIIRMVIDAYSSKSDSHLLLSTEQAIRKLGMQAAAGWVSTQQQWSSLQCLVPRLQYSVALVALRQAALSSLAETEHSLNMLFESGNWTDVAGEMIRTLQLISGAFSTMGVTEVGQVSASLAQALKLRNAASVDLSAAIDFSPVISEWVRLCNLIEVWPAQEVSPHRIASSDSIRSPIEKTSVERSTDLALATFMPRPDVQPEALRETHSPERSASGDTHTGTGADITAGIDSGSSTALSLVQIFILEATQRLAELRRTLSEWVAKPCEPVPLASACEAHALAGCSATVGLMRLHDGALALEQVIERLSFQPVAQQHHHAASVMLGVQALERELQWMQDSDGNSDQNADLPSSQLTAQENSQERLSKKSPETFPEKSRTALWQDDQAKIPDALHDLLALAEQFSDYSSDCAVPLRLASDKKSLQLTERLTGKEQEKVEKEKTDDIKAAEEAEEIKKIENEIIGNTLGTHMWITENRLPADERDPLSSPAGVFYADAELLAVFSEEAAELLPQLAQQMSDWRATPQDQSLPSQLLRVLHTLKGSARMAGEMELGDRLHQMEHDVGQLAREDRPADASLQSLQHEIHQVLVDTGIAPAAAMSDVTPTPDAEMSSVADKHCIDAASAQAKVRTDLLERAAGSAAELLVGVVRAAEDLQQQRHTVSELAENLARLRAQLRELELQSESRIASQALPSASAFDPLEFDRYTRLQELTRMTAESLADLTSLQRSLSHQADSAATVISQQTRHARLLQSDLRRARMQVFSSIELRLRHLVRQVASEAGREVRFEIDGGQVEIDRAQLDRLNGPLQHLIRNAIVHGIETPDERALAGKARHGVVRIVLSPHSSELRLQISDDGRGLNFGRIRDRAAELGLLDQAKFADDAKLSELIFEPGLSTADEVTGLAGRGIGMDAVKAAVISMGGALKVDSLPGEGTCITLGLPQLLSTQQVLVVTGCGHKIALPASMVQQVMQPSDAVLAQAVASGSIEWQRQTMPLRGLGELLGTGIDSSFEQHRVSIIVLRQLDQWLAISVNEVLGHREVVVKQAGAQLMGVPGLAGATLQPDGSVLLIMNLLQLSEHHGLRLHPAQLISSVDQISDKAPLVMVVDDSLTVRRVSQRLLERHGYQVAIARHGIEALEQLRDITPVAVLLDIEMPRMDGFELLSRLRADPRLQAVPVAMITSRAAERHRQHAMQLGANAYFGKPYREQEIFDWLALFAPVLPQPVNVQDEAAA